MIETVLISKVLIKYTKVKMALFLPWIRLIFYKFVPKEFVSLHLNFRLWESNLLRIYLWSGKRRLPAYRRYHKGRQLHARVRIVEWSFRHIPCFPG